MKTTKEELQEKAVMLFKEKGYAKVSIDEICSACGVSKGSFYHHFSTKAELLFGYWEISCFSPDIQISRLDEATSEKERLWIAFSWSIDDVLDHIDKTAMKELWIADIKRGNTLLNPYQYQTSPGVKHYTQILYGLLDKARAAGEVHTLANNEEILFALYSAVICLKMYWACSEEEYDLFTQCRRIFDTIVR